MGPPMIRDATSGYWGFPTSTMDWCEENYQVTPYIAEFWNTVSNVVFVVPPSLMAYHLWRYRLSDLGHIVCLLLLTLVGIGSFFFHCTLLYESQLLDELPMIYGTCAMLYCVMDIRSEPNKCNTRLVAVLTTIASFITIFYATFKNPLIFLWSYGIMAIVLLAMNIKECIFGHGSKSILLLGAGSYGFGFILWNIDNELCYYVRDVRASAPGMIAPITQLHAWWHVFAGIGTFLTILYSLHLRITHLGNVPALKMLHCCLPYYVKGQRRSNTDVSKSFNGQQSTRSSVKLKSRPSGIIDSFARLL